MPEFPSVTSPSDDQQHGISSTVIIRSFQRSDQSECEKIFTDGVEEFFKEATLVFLSTVSREFVIATVFTSVAAILWSTWILAVYAVVVFCFLAFVHIMRLQGFNWLNSVLKTEFKDIEKSYMSSEGCHMWVAEWSGEVVGMVGLMRKETHEPGVAELQRMYIVPSCRGKGIGKKLLNELTAHAKRQMIRKIVLATTSTQKPAIQLYKKHGIKLVTVSNVFRDITLKTFSMEL